MRVMALTTRKDFTQQRLFRLVSRLDLGDDLDIELVTVHTPRRKLAVRRVDTVDPSVIPWRPVVPVSGEGVATWHGPRRLVARGLRAVRRAGSVVPRPESLRIDDGTFLAVACATSAELARRAQEVDVVVAVEREAARAAYQLAKRADRPVVVDGASKVRRVLEASERPVPRPAAPADFVGDTGKRASRDLPDPPEPASRSVLIAPANYAGQAYAWAEAVRAHVPDATAMNTRVGVLKRGFTNHYTVDSTVFAGDLEWRLAWRDFVDQHFTHVIAEVNLPILGSIAGDGEQHVRELLSAGKKVALLSHGSDARIPSVHAERERWHSYEALDPKLLRHLEERARINVELYNSFDGTVFVSTPGLLEFVPAAVWLPLVVDVGLWEPDHEPMRREVPIVAHIPSSAQKGSHMIDPILTSMHDRGLIEYRRVEGVPHAEMPTLYGTADMMVEQFGIADYSAAACEAMAAGRVVVSRVADNVRDHVREQTGRDLPIAEANPETLEQVILGLVQDRDRARALAQEGRSFVREVHDGRRSAQVLQTWLDETSG